MPPDFLCIGASKAGTTWLYENLKNHPGIWMPPIKELHYFDLDPAIPADKITLVDRLFSKHLDHARWRQHLRGRIKDYLLNPSCIFSELLWDVRYFLGSPSDPWYASLFNNASSHVSGEITPAYSYLHSKVIARIHQLMPHLKIVFLMRNPIEQGWSSIRMHFRWGELDIENEDEIYRFFENLDDSIHGNYLWTLSQWEKFYPKDRWFIAFFEEVVDNPHSLLMRLYRFLEVDADPRHIPKNVRARVFAGPDIPIPPKIAAYLAKRGLKQIQALEKRFGGYSTSWVKSTQALLRD